MIRLGNATDWPARAPNSEELPYEIRVRGWSLWCSVGFYLISGLACIAGAVWYWFSTHWEPLGKAVIVACFCSVGCLLFWPIYFLLRPSFILFPDRIEKIGLTGSRVLDRRSIEGVEVLGDSSESQFAQLKPIDGLGKPIRIARKALLHPVLARWLDGVRDLTAEAYQRSQDEVLADARFGATETERASRLAFAQRLVQIASIIGAGVYFWALIYPHPYLWAIGAATLLPLAAIVLVWTSNGLIIWDSDKATARPGVIGLVWGGAGILALRAFLDIDLIDWWQLAAVSAGIGVVVAAFLMRANTESQRVLVVLLVAFLPGAYVYGVAAQANIIFDNSRAETFRVSVSGKSASTGRNASYEIKVGPWGGRPAGTLTTTRKLYDETPINSPVCVYRHAGWFKLRWFFVDHCDDWKPTKPPGPILKP